MIFDIAPLLLGQWRRSMSFGAEPVQPWHPGGAADALGVAVPPLLGRRSFRQSMAAQTLCPRFSDAFTLGVGFGLQDPVLDIFQLVLGP